MKSDLFAKHELLSNEEFKLDIMAALSLPSSVLEQLSECALKHLAAPTRGEADQIASETAQALGVPKTQLDRAIEVSRFFLREFAPSGDASADSVSSVADDVCDALSLDAEKTEKIERLLSELKPVATAEAQLILLQRAHAETALPILNAVSGVVDFRAVFDEAYKYEKDVGAYSPKFMGTIPVGIVEILLKGAHSEEVFFQVTPRTLQILIDHLTALQRQMSISQRELGSR